MAQQTKVVSTSQILSSVAGKYNQVPKKMTKAILADFLSAIEAAVGSGNKVRIDKMGIIQSKERAPRKGRNPQTGEEIQIPASRKIAFRVAKSLKDQLSMEAMTSSKISNLSSNVPPKASKSTQK